MTPAVAQPVLVGVSDIARDRRVTRQRINDLTHHPAWPQPVPSASGRRWWNTDVAAFFAVDRPPGRPRTAVRTTRADEEAGR